MEETVKIVKIRGKGAGIESITELPRASWERMQADASKGFKEVLDWKLITSKADIKVEIPKEELGKTPEEIIAEAQMSLSMNESETKKTTSKK